MKNEQKYQLFIPFEDIAANPDKWYMFFPFREVFHMGRKVDFTEDNGVEMVANFAADVLNYPPPINSLHDDTLGIFGEIGALRVGETCVEWKPLFNDGAIEELTEKGYKYASPEIVFSDYTGVYDGATYNNVAMGIAICPRPRLGKDTRVFSDGEIIEYESDETPTEEQVDEYWKRVDARWAVEDAASIVGNLRTMALRNPAHSAALNSAAESLKPLIHEQVDEMGDVTSNNSTSSGVANKTSGGERKMADVLELNDEQLAEVKESLFSRVLGNLFAKSEPEAEPKHEESNSANLEDAAELVKLQDENAQLQAEVTEFKDAKVAAEKVAFEERQKARKLEYTEVSKTISGLPVENDVFAETLMWLEDADDSDDKAHYAELVRVLKALGNQEKTAALFSEIGNDSDAPKDAVKAFDDAVTAVEKDRGVARGEAIQIVAQTNPQLYADYNTVTVKTI